jgi:hypothetical protein
MTEITGTSGCAFAGLFRRFRPGMLARTQIILTGKLQDNILNYFNTASLHTVSTSLFTTMQSLWRNKPGLYYTLSPMECLQINKTVIWIFLQFLSSYLRTQHWQLETISHNADRKREQSYNSFNLTDVTIQVCSGNCYYSLVMDKWTVGKLVGWLYGQSSGIAMPAALIVSVVI